MRVSSAPSFVRLFTRVLAVATVVAVALMLASPSKGTKPLEIERTAVLRGGNGYWLTATDGGVFSFGPDAPFYGSTGDIRLNQPIVGMTASPTGAGYWFVASDGGIFSFGDAQFYGSTGDLRLNQPIVGMAATPTGNGYWLVASDGGIFTFGDAQFYGSTGNIRLNQPIVGMAPTPTGEGYWFVASDGGIFSFGDAQFFGSTGDIRLNEPIVGMAASPFGDGYWFVASDGGIFSFGDAPFYGSTGDLELPAPIVDMESTPTGAGYWFVGADGEVYEFGDAPFLGSTGDIELNQPVVGMAAAPAFLVDDVPVANDDTFTLTEDTQSILDVLANDEGLSDGDLTMTIVSEPSKGTVSIRQDGTIRYVPNPNANGTDTFVYDVADIDDQVDDATVTVTITPVNDAPTISAIGNRTIAEDGTTGPIAFTVADVDDATSSLTLTATSSNTDLLPVANIVFGGTNGSRTVTATPAENQSGTSDVTIRVADATGAAATEPFTLTVTAANDAPTIVDVTGPAATNNQTPTFSGTVSDPDHDTVTVEVAVDEGAFSSSGVTGGKTFSWTPTEPLDEGVHDIHFRATDGADAPSEVVTRTVDIDLTGPSVTVTAPEGPTNEDTIDFTVEFDEPVTGFDEAADVTISGSAGATTASITGTGTTYNVAVSGMTSDGEVTVGVPAEVATDEAGNPNDASPASATVTYDATEPSVTIDQASGQGDPTNGDAVEFTAVFSEAVTGFTGDDVTVGGTGGGDRAVTVTGSGTTYTVTITGLTDGTVTADIPAGSATDAAGNPNTASESTDNEVTREADKPTVAIALADGQPSPSNESTIDFEVTFSEPVTGFEADDLTIGGTAGGTKQGAITGDGPTYNVAVTGHTGQGTVTLEIAQNRVTDLASNNNMASNTATADYDGIAPTVTVNEAIDQDDPTNEGSIDFTVVFSEAVTGFTEDDVTIGGDTGATTAAITGDGPTYNVAISGMTNDGEVTVDIAEARVTDAVGNANSASTSTDNSVIYDKTAPVPTVSVPMSQENPTDENVVDFTVTFSEDVSDFADEDVIVGGAANPTTATVSGGPSVYNVAVTGQSTDGPITVTIPAGAAADEAGNTSTASNTGTVTYDKTGPTVTINQAGGQEDPTDEDAIEFTAVFSEAVSGFTGADVSFAGSDAPEELEAAISGTGPTYTVTVSGMSTDGDVVVSITAGSYTDVAGNTGAASTSTDNTVTYDATAPTFDAISVTAGSPIVTLVFSEPLRCSTVAAGDFTATKGDPIQLPVAVESVSCTGTTDDVIELTLASAVGATDTVTITRSGAVEDAAGNTSAALPESRSATAPTLTVTSPANGTSTNDATPTFTGTSSDEDGSVARVEVKVDSADFVTADDTAPESWSWTPTTDLGEGPHTITFRAVDDGGSISATVVRTITVDTEAPTVTVEQAEGQDDPTNASPIDFTVTFSEAVTGFTNDDLTVDSTAGAVTATVTGGPTVYNVAVSGMSTQGTVSVSLGAGKVIDAAGNENLASTSEDGEVAFDPTAPTVTIVQALDQDDPTGDLPIRFTVVFSEPVEDFDDPADVTITGGGGAKTVTIDGEGAAYTVSLSDVTDGSYQATIPGGVATDLAGNANAASSGGDNAVTYDGTAPTVVVAQAEDQADPTNDTPIVFDVTFSEPVFGFTADDIDFTGSEDAGVLAAAIDATDAPHYVVSVTGMVNDGDVVVGVPAGAVTDDAGNDNTVSAAGDDTVVVYDTTGPSVTIDQAASQTDPTNANPIVFTAVFTEPVVPATFTAADVDLSDSTAAGTLVPSISGGPSTFTVSVSGATGDGDVIASILAGGVEDLAGNTNAASTSTDATVAFETDAPVGESIAPQGGTHLVSVLFDEEIDCDTADAGGFDVTVEGELAIRTVDVDTCDGSTIVLSAEPTLGGAPFAAGDSVTVAIAAGAVTDLAGNDADEGELTNIVPAATITAPAPTNDTTPSITGTASDDDTDEALDISAVEVSVDGGAYSSDGVVLAPGDEPRSWTWTAPTALTAGSHTITARSVDAAGATSPASGTSVLIDLTAPTVTIDKGAEQDDPTNAGPIVFDVVFSEAVTGFTEEDVDVSTSTVGGTLVVDVAGSGAAYTVTVTGMTGNGTVVASIPAGGASDTAGNTNAASTSTDNSVLFDTTAPTVTIEQGGEQADPTNSSPIVFDVTFSELVTGFDGSDVDFTGSDVEGTLVAEVTGSGSSYVVSVTGMSGDGDVVASVPAGAATDAAGNGNAVSTSTDNVVTYDDVAPTVTIALADGQDDVTNASPITFTVVFSEPVDGFTGEDIDLSGTATGASATVTDSGDATTFTVEVSGMTDDGTVVASVPAAAATDAAGNDNTAAPAAASVTYDTTRPTVTIARAEGQEDPTNDGDNRPTTGDGSVDFTVVFSEPVTGFDEDDVSVTLESGTAVHEVTGSGTTYTVSVSSITAVEDALITVSVLADGATDAAGNGNDASDEATVLFDAVRPALAAVAGYGGTGTVDAIFTEALDCDTVALADFLDAVTVGGTPRLVTDAACDGDTVTITLETLLSGDLASGDVVSVSIAEDAVQDVSGRNVMAGTVANAVPDTPVVGSEPPPLTNDATPTVDGTASDDDTAEGKRLSAVEVSVDGGAFEALPDPDTDPATWSWTPAVDLADGEHTVAFRSVDESGATSEVAEVTFTVDATPPSMEAVTARALSPTVTITFSEALDCATVAQHDFAVAWGGSPKTKTNLTCSGDTVVITLTTSPAEGQVVTVTLSGSVADLAGNTSTSHSLDGTAGPAL